MALLHSWPRAAGSLVLATLWLFTMAASGSHALHAFLHSEAHHVSHDCVLVQVAQGQVETPSREPSAPEPIGPRWVGLIPPSRIVLPGADVLLHAARGPPGADLPLP